MLGFFYYTRNILGLILVISPLTGFLFIDSDLNLSIVLIAAAIAGIFIAGFCYKKMPFKLWTAFFCVGACVGALITQISESSAAIVAGNIILGISAGGLLVVLPPNIIISWFMSSKTAILGIVWSNSLLLGIFLGQAVERYTYPAFAVSLVSMIAGSIFLIQKPYFVEFWTEENESPIHIGEKRLTIAKAFLFFLFCSFAIGISFFTVQNDDSFANSITLQNSLMVLIIAGLGAGFLLAVFFTESRGIYSSCILLLFMAQISFMNFTFLPAITALTYISAFAGGAALSSMMIIIPILAYYLCWQAKYTLSTCVLFSALPIGLLLAHGATTLLSEGTLRPDAFAALVMILLAAGFFTVFSAWKHRFTLLR